MPGKDIGIAGDWTLDRTEGMNELLRDGLEMGFIKRKAAEAAQAAKSWSSSGSGYTVKQDGLEFTIISESGGESRTNTFLADGKPFFYETGGLDAGEEDNAVATIDDDMLVVDMEGGEMGGKRGKLLIKRFVNSDGELQQEIEFRGAVMTRFYVAAEGKSSKK